MTHRWFIGMTSQACIFHTVTIFPVTMLTMVLLIELSDFVAITEALQRNFTFPELEFNYNGTHIHPSAGDWLPKCVSFVDSQRSSVREPDVRLPPKPDLAIIESCSRPDTEYDYATAIIACYAKYKGYLHFRDFFSTDATNQYFDSSKDHFFNYRWKLLSSRYFHTANWVVGMDSDHATVNFNADMLSYLDVDPPNEEVDIVVHVRKNWEIVAGNLALRTASSFSLCFIEYLSSMSIMKLANYDNGDIMQLLYDLVFYKTPIPSSEHCHRGPERHGSWIPYQKYFIPCFGESWYTKILEDAGYRDGVPRHGKILKGIKLKDWPIRVYFPMAGFWRDFNGPADGVDWYNKGVDDPTFHSGCLETDLLIHGWKWIGTHLITPEIYSCSFQSVDDNKLFHPGTAILKTCPLKSWNNTMDFIMANCYWHYHGCFEKSVVDGSVSNKCFDLAHCSHQWYFKTGIGHPDVQIHNMKEGLLVKCPPIAGRSVFLYSNGTLHSFENLQAFTSRGFDFDQVVELNRWQFQKIPIGTSLF